MMSRNILCVAFLMCFFGCVPSEAIFLQQMDVPSNFLELYHFSSSIYEGIKNLSLSSPVLIIGLSALVLFFIISTSFALPLALPYDSYNPSREEKELSYYTQLFTSCLLQTFCEISRDPQAYGSFGTASYSFLSGVSSVPYVKASKWFEPYLQALITGRVASSRLNPQPSACRNIYRCKVPLQTAFAFTNFFFK